MKQFLTLINFEFKTKLNLLGGTQSKIMRVLKIILILIGVLAIETAIFFVSKYLLAICKQGRLENEFIMFYIFIIQIIQILFGISKITKTLYFSNDYDLIKLPISGTTIFASKIVFLFCYELIFSVLSSLPALIVFGITTNLGAFFYVFLPISMILIAFVPFCVSIILSILVKKIISILSNKYKILLIIYILLICVGFFLYVQALQALINLFSNENIAELGASNVDSIKRIASYFYLQVLIKNTLIGVHFWQSLIVYIFTAALLFIAVLYVAKYSYFKELLSSLQGRTKSFTKDIQVKERKPGYALFRKELITIFRSPNYSFQYLTVVSATPIMVFCCNLIATNLTSGKFGLNIIPGISVLVITMFLTLGCSFSATSISREGGNFYFTKIFPLSFKKQIFIKFLVHASVGVISALLTCLLLAILPCNIFSSSAPVYFLTFPSALLIGLAVCLIVVGSVASSISSDIKNPYHKEIGDGEITGTNRNINMSLIIGFVISIILGVSGLVLSLFVSIPALYLVLYGFSIPFALIQMLVLFKKADARYASIEV